MPDTSPLLDSPDESLDETVGNMNEAAGKTAGQRTLRKRKTMQDEDDARHPSRRLRTLAENQSRLSRPPRKAVSGPRHQYSRQDPWEPEEHENAPHAPLPGETISQSQDPRKHKAVRSLVRRQTDHSPLKGLGMINMSTSEVDLDDSPPKSKKTRVRTNFVLEVPAQANPPHPIKNKAQSSEFVTSDGGNPVDEVPEQLVQEQVDTGILEGDKENRKASWNKKNGKTRVLTRAGRQIQAEVSQEDSETQELEAIVVREVVLPEKKDDVVARLIRPIDHVADFAGGRTYWEDIFYYAHRIVQERGSNRAGSENGKRLCRRIEYLKREFQGLSLTQYDDDYLSAQMEELESRLRDFRTPNRRDPQSNESDEDYNDEKYIQDEKTRDLYQHIVPDLVFLLRSAVVARSLCGTPDSAAWKDLMFLMKRVIQAANIASASKPTPSDISRTNRSSVVLILERMKSLGATVAERDYHARWAYVDPQLEELRARRQQFFSRR